MDMKRVFGINKSMGSSAPKTKSYRSSSFERQFEGYTHHVEISATGRKRVVHTYTGMYYEPEMSVPSMILRRIVYLLLYGLSVAALVFYGSYGYQSQWSKLLVLPEMGILFSLIWTGLKLLFYVTAPRKMTVGEYKGSCLALKQSAKWVVVCWIVSACLLLLAALLSGEEISLWLPSLTMLLAGCAADAGILLLEKRVRYSVLPNE